MLCRVQRKSFLQLAIRASCSWHLIAQMSFQLAPKPFWRAELISQFFCYSNSSKNVTCPSGKLKTEFTSPIAESTSPGLSDTTFFACCYGTHTYLEILQKHIIWAKSIHFLVTIWPWIPQNWQKRCFQGEYYAFANGKLQHLNFDHAVLFVGVCH